MAVTGKPKLGQMLGILSPFKKNKIKTKTYINGVNPSPSAS
jgi:hypothetical protein